MGFITKIVSDLGRGRFSLLFGAQSCLNSLVCFQLLAYGSLCRKEVPKKITINVYFQLQINRGLKKKNLQKKNL